MLACIPCCSKDDDRVTGPKGTEEWEPVTGAAFGYEEEHPARRPPPAQACSASALAAKRDAPSLADAKEADSKQSKPPPPPQSPQAGNASAGSTQCPADSTAADEAAEDAQTPPDAATQFRALLRKGDPHPPMLGAHFDLCDGVLLLLVSIEKGGAVQAYNRTVPKGMRLVPGDYVASVNAVSGDSETMVKEMEAQSDLELEVRRSMEFMVEVSKTGGPLGLDISYAEAGQSLLIGAIMEGLIADWNKANPQKKVCANDRIVEVNGVSGTPEELLAAIKQATATIRMRLARPS